MLGPEQIANYFATYLDRRIHKAQLRLVDATVQTKSGISVELFLCALHLVYGRAVLGAFNERDNFLRMEGEMLPQSQTGRYGRTRRIQSTGVFMKYDQSLRDLLWDAIRVARASGRSRAGLREILTALCLNDALVEQLKSTRGISPVGFLPKMPDIVHKK